MVRNFPNGTWGEKKDPGGCGGEEIWARHAIRTLGWRVAGRRPAWEGVKLGYESELFPDLAHATLHFQGK